MHILLIVIVHVNNHIKNVDHIFFRIKKKETKDEFHKFISLSKPLLKHCAKKDRKRKSTLKVGSNFLNSKIYQ